MTNNTKLKQRLWYFSNLSCIVRLVLSRKETVIDLYNDILKIINKVKLENEMAKNVRAYILQV